MDLVQDFTAGEDDFAAFLDLPNYGLDMPFDQTAQTLAPMPTATTAWSSYNGRNMPSQPSGQVPQMPVQMAQQQHQVRPSQSMAHQFAGPQAVPPTPNSLELQATAAQLIQQMDPRAQQVFLERLRGMREDQQFSPLVSPAITPRNSHFNVPEFNNQIGYYTPRESPMIEPQSHQSFSSRQHMHRRNTGPPMPSAQMHMDLVMEEYTPNTPNNSGSRRTKRKSTSSRTPGRVVQQSPAMKPQRRRQPSTTITPELAATLLAARRPDVSPYISGLARESNSCSSSGMDSVSPEPLSEPLMGPPQPPRQSTPLSRNLSRNRSSSEIQYDSSGQLSSVTPASLMQLPRQPSFHLEESQSRPTSRRQSSEDLVRQARREPSPHVQRSMASLPRLTTVLPPGQGRTSGSSGSVTRGNSTTRSAAPSSTTTVQSSPQILASHHKSNASPAIGADRSRKRPVTATLQPAVAAQSKTGGAPKPLLPEGARTATVASAHSALLLAAKSNYQNILDGQSSALGLEYPEHMSQHLTSKRTSHKIAEQGRRQRINVALQEIATLLPASFKGPKTTDGALGPDEGDSPVAEKGGQKPPAGSMSANLAAQTTSKASTVETAIEYIKSLQRELEETKGRLMAAEQRLVAGGQSEAGVEQHMPQQRIPAQAASAAQSELSTATAVSLEQDAPPVQTIMPEQQS